MTELGYVMGGVIVLLLLGFSHLWCYWSGIDAGKRQAEAFQAHKRRKVFGHSHDM